ncbi:MAG: DUF393 domain-containing protein [Actinomycetota bacterium]|nr:DUF393 domain-containing protein [Actinomycetota bacterium]
MIPIDMAREHDTGSIPSGGPGRNPPASVAPGRWTVFYDADCGFCRTSLAFLLVLDREHQLAPVAIQTPAADAVLADLSAEERMRSWHLIAPDGRRFSAGAAATPLLRLLPGGAVPAALLRSAPTLTERTYRWVADHRSSLSQAIPNRLKAYATALIERRGDTTMAGSVS